MATTVDCADCGKPFTAQRRTARFCSATCRSRAHQKAPEVVTAVEAPPTVPEPPVPDPPLVEAVVKELTEAGKLASRRGQQAVVMARKLASASTTASSAASLSKALDEMMDSLTAPQGLGPSPTTRRGTLAQRRQQKRGAA
jgi:hypothetical protein